MIGASLGTNLSRIEEAERSVMQWEAIIANIRRAQPQADLSGLENQRDKAREIFEQMEESDENLVPMYVISKKSTVAPADFPAMNSNLPSSSVSKSE